MIVSETDTFSKNFKKKPRILLDMDDVIVDLASSLARVYNDLYNDSLTPEELFIDWDIHRRAKCGEEIYQIFQRENFFYSLREKQGAVAGVQMLRHFFEINIVTSIPSSPEAAKDKVRWVRDYMSFYNVHDMFMAKRKHLISGDIMIDDYVNNLLNWQKHNPNGKVILFEAHHNVLHRKDFTYVVKNWDELNALLGKLYSEVEL